MNHSYSQGSRLVWLRLLLVILLLSGSTGALRAQSGPYGNEWIVPGQPYYKIQTVQDGLYRLDNAYLTQAGITGVNPSQLQLWRRGKQVAIYVGGNAAAQDASTYVEFFGQGNDAKLDRGMFKKAMDQAQIYTSMYTDTAAYFLTWSAATAGKRMAQPTASVPVTAAATYWLRPELQVHGYSYNDVDEVPYLFQPWGEPAEGFFSGNMNTNGFTFTVGTEQRQNIAAGARLEVRIVGTSRVSHAVEVAIEQPSGTRRLLGTERFDNYANRTVSYALQPGDFPANGNVRVQIKPTAQSDNARVAYFNITYPQTPRWVAARSSRYFASDSTRNTPAYYVLDSIPASVVGYDVTDPYTVQRIAGTAAEGRKRGYYFPGATPEATRRFLLADTERPLAPVLPARRVSFLSLQPAAVDFLIVTSPVQMQAAGNVPNAAKAYADYRTSTAGGKHDVLMVTSQQLYDQFHYGEKSALAIRQFALWMLTDKSREKFLLLLGKGYHVGEYFNGAYPRAMKGVEQVPTSTRSASDIFFTADWPRDNYVPGMATGRVSAQNPQQVMNYLNKLKEHEALGLETWRKNALNLAGGKNAAEFNEFQGYVNKYKQLIEAPCFGGKVVKTYVSSAGLPVNINISEELNKGLSLITYFGHGSFYSFDLTIGNINDATNNYNNKGKYPVMFLNGCAAGNTYTPYPSMGEDWMMAADKGFVGFMCESGFGYSNDLDDSQTMLYKLLMNDPAWYGKPVASAWQEVARRRQSVAQYSLSAASNLMCTIWQGDPALRLFSPEKPDFVVSNDSLQLPAVASGGTILASDPSFKLAIHTGNLGSTCDVSKLDICITRKYPATLGRKDDAYSFSFTPTQRDNVYTVDIPNTGNVFGENTFIVKLDCNNLIDELNETNNEAQLKYNFLQGGVSTLSPPEFAIVPSNAVRLVGQSNLLAADPRGFEMELDTVPTFNSPLVRRNTTTGRLLADWQAAVPTVAGRDSVVWYWRLRLQTPQAGENSAWATSSFRIIQGSTGGWSQSHYGQFQRDTRQRVDVLAPATRWNFTDTPRPITLRTQGAVAGRNTFLTTYGITLDGKSPYVNDCALGEPGMLVTVYDGRTLHPVRTVAGAYDSCGRAPASFYRFNGINSATRQAQLLQLLRNVPAGNYVAVVSVNRVNFPGFSAELKAAFTALGSKLITTIQEGDPFLMIGQKGPGAHPVQERTYDAASATGRYDQVVTLDGTLGARGGSGVVTSTLIGPAQQWTTLFHTVRTETNDSYTVRLLGVDANGNATVLNPNVTNRTYSLAGVSATQYPYLQVQVQLRDTLDRTAPQLKQLMVAYKGVPEGVARPDLAAADAYTAATLTRQAAGGFVTIPVKFQNISPLDFGTPLKAEITLRDASNRTATALVEYKGGVLKAGETATFDVTANVVNLAGAVTGSVYVNPRLLPEQYYFNNELVLPTFNLSNNSTPPTLDVAFDGQHILNGDIVSPSPVVTAQLQTSNVLRPIKNASNFSLFLVHPATQGTAGVTETIDMNSAQVAFMPDSAKGTARIEYRPGKALPDGTYTLIAQGRDASGTAAGSQEYRVSFEVINASTITNVYPYPNPMTTKAKFVFTLTGAEVPRNMKIQILSLTGRVVREIMMGELGPLHIGNNITDYAWDGTDEYGDRLANGTYLYRVLLDDPNSDFKKRNTAGDKAFKKDWGKIVLLR